MGLNPDYTKIPPEYTIKWDTEGNVTQVCYDKDLYISPETFKEIRDWDTQKVDEAVKKELFVNPNPHWHCNRCWGEEFIHNVYFGKICKNCYENDESYKEMIICTPMVCASS